MDIRIKVAVVLLGPFLAAFILAPALGQASAWVSLGLLIVGLSYLFLGRKK